MTILSTIRITLIFWILSFIYSNQCFSEEFLEEISVTEDTPTQHSSISGFDTAIQQTPLSLSNYDQQKLQSAKVKRLSEISTLDASVTDSYNSSGYWDIISIRGFTLDNRSSFQREGLPINAETSIPLENKERIEVLKGLASLYAGATVPGGLVNYVVKRPTPQSFRNLHLEWSQQNNQLVSADINQKISDKVGVRFNVAQEKIDPLIRNAEGHRSLLAGAFNYRMSENTFLDTEIEWSRRSQPSVPGFSLLGNRLPSVPDPNLNLNNQTWTKPVVFEGLTGSMQLTQALEYDWVMTFMAGGQRLITDDRLAYPFGCSNEGNFDRFCTNGTYDLYDYRSENERRETNTLKLKIEGQVKQDSLKHHLSFGSWYHTAKDRMSRQAYNFAGEGSVDGNNQVPSDSALTSEGTNRDSIHLDFFAFDRIEYQNWSLWLGARQTSITRKSAQTDGTRKINYQQDFILPWSAVSYQFPSFLSYISYGEGTETFVTPNRAEYRNQGQSLPGVVSRQWEAGLKGSGPMLWSLSFFQIKRPLISDLPPEYRVDGEARQRGLEAAIEKSSQPWYFGISYMKVDVETNKKKAINVPDQTIRSFVGHDFANIKGLRADVRWIYEGKRAITANNEFMLRSWNKWDLSLSYLNKRWLTQLYLENAFARRYWKESPTQYGHIYLFPGSDRKLTLSGQYHF